MYSRSIQKKVYVMAEIVTWYILATVTKYTPHLAFVLLQITTLHLYWLNLQSYECVRPSVRPSVPPSLTPFLPPAVTHFVNYSFIENHKLNH